MSSNIGMLIQQKNQIQATFPLIFKKSNQNNYSNQREIQSNQTSLYKNDSESSQLSIKHQQQLLRRRQTRQQNPLIELKKYLKKADDLNQSNFKKLKEDKYVQQLPKQDRSSASLYKYTRDVSLQNVQENQRQKNIKKVYLGKKGLKGLKQPVRKIKAIVNKKRLTTVNQQVQTLETIDVKKKMNKSHTKNHSFKINSLTADESIQLLQDNQNVNIQRINENNNLKKNKKQTFKNLTSILQKQREEQELPPKKEKHYKVNNLRTNKMIQNNSTSSYSSPFAGQQSTAPSTYANSYLESMSKLSYNFGAQVDRIKKNKRYDQYKDSTVFNRYSHTIDISARNFDNNLSYGSGYPQIQTKQNDFYSLKNTADSPTTYKNVSNQVEIERLKKNDKNQSRKRQQLNKNNLGQKLNNRLSQSNIKKDEQSQIQQINMQNFLFNINERSQKKSTSMIAEQSQHKKTKESDDQTHQTMFFRNHVKSREKQQELDNDKGSIIYQNYNNDNRHMNASSHRERQYRNNKTNYKQDQFVQFPQVNQLKIFKQNQQFVAKNSKMIHPIRNNFQQGHANWITQNFKPKSDLFRSIDLSNFHIKKYKNGVYFGQLSENQQKKNGHGIIFYFNGRLYQGTFEDNLKSGKGLQQFPDGSKYNGQFKNGLKQGKGIFQWPNGEVYQGQWSKGKKNGSGIWKSNQGESYIGEWKNGLVQGFGVYISKNGDRYEGQFKNSQKHGLGTQRFANGQTYVGYYKKNRPNGQGQYFWMNGDYYKGYFSNSIRHGQGYFKQNKEGYIFKGQYRNDKKCGYGQLKYSCGQIYIGNFQNDLRHGYGQLYRNDQIQFKGYWVNDRQLQDEDNSKDVTPQSISMEGKKIVKRQNSIIMQRPELENKAKFNKVNPLNKNQNSSLNRQNTRNSNNRNPLKSKSPLRKSLQTKQLSPDQSHVRACGCARKH